MTADQLELITAAVDGELSATETRAFRALIAASDQARKLYEKLKADSDRVRALSRVSPPADLRAKVLARLATFPHPPRVKPKPHVQPAPQKTRRLPSWVPAALAASVFLCLATASFGFFTRQADVPSTTTAGKSYWTNTLPAQHDRSPAVPSPTASPVERPDPAAVVRVDVSPVPPVPAPRLVPPDAVTTAPEPRAVHDFHASRLLPKLPPFDRVQVRLPFLRSVSELDREDIRQELFEELRREPAFKIDVFVRDTARGAEVFQNAAKAAGLTVFADAATLEKLKKRQAHAVVIYTESLTPAELATLFATLATEDAKFSPRVCDSLHATSIVRSEETELKAILGLDVGLLKRPTGAGPSSAGQGGEPKNVSAGTIDSVVKSVSPKPGDKSAVLLTWQTAHANIPRTNPATSAELKQFLAKRGDRKPNAVPAIIVIRPVG